MIKLTRTYTDYNGVEKTEDFFFHLSEAEILDMELETEGGFIETINKISNAKDLPQLIKLFRRLLHKSYGEKTPDGGFLKNDEILAKFMAKKAYSDIYVELATNDELGSEFVKKVVPSKMNIPQKSN